MPTIISYRELLEKVYRYNYNSQSFVTLWASYLNAQNKEEDIYGSVSAYEVPATREQEIYAQLKTWGVTYIHERDVK